MNKMKIKIFTLLGLIITFSLALSSCDSLWDDLNTLPTYTINYVSDKGTAPETKTVEQGYKLTAEDLPTLIETGYNFKGWDKVVGDEITSDTTITASWTKTWTITYNSNNGTGTMEPQIFEENVSQALSENKFTREGYTFAGWATKADASTAEYADKANYTATKDITLYAIWSVIPPVHVPSKYTITYASAYGTKPANKEVDKGYKLTSSDLPDLGETGDKYFDKWDKTVGTEITADTTITANWETIVYLKKLASISEISSKKSNIEKIVFTSDTYSGASTTIDCADNSTNPAISPDYFKGVLTDGTVSGQYILTIYGNGHRIYAPIDCAQLFSNYNVLTTIEFNNFYTSKTTKMTVMFYNSKELTSLNVSGFNTSEVTDMTGMFWNCSKLTSLDVSNFDTSKVTTMQNMFNGLTVTKLDLSNFVTTSVNNMSAMFQSCKNLTSVNVSSFNTSAVTNMSNMFYNCNALKSIDISSFSSSAVTNVKQMFHTCSELVTIYVSAGFDLSNATTKDVVFKNTNKLVGGAGTTCDGSNNVDGTYAHIDGGTSNPGYFTLKQ